MPGGSVRTCRARFAEHLHRLQVLTLQRQYSPRCSSVLVLDFCPHVSCAVAPSWLKAREVWYVQRRISYQPDNSRMHGIWQRILSLRYLVLRGKHLISYISNITAKLSFMDCDHAFAADIMD